MRLEEEVRSTWEQADFNSQEDRELAFAQDYAIQASYKMLTSWKFRKRTNILVDAQFKKWQDRANRVIEDYHGPSSGRPKRPQAWEMFQRRKDLLREVKEAYMMKEALASSDKISRQMAQARQFWYGDYLFKIMMRDTVDIIIREVVNEAMEEGLRAKFTAENISGIRFPDPEWMQYDMYATLAASWRRRKEFLRIQVLGNTHSHTHT